MKLSTRSRYGVRLMTVLARRISDGPVFLKEIAAAEDLSEKYLSLIVIPLRAAGLIRSIRGAKGGYVLARHPAEISLRDIMAAVEEDMNLVPCVKKPASCARSASCATRDVWERLSNTMTETMSGITLDQLAGVAAGKGSPQRIADTEKE